MEQSQENVEFLVHSRDLLFKSREICPDKIELIFEIVHAMFEFVHANVEDCDGRRGEEVWYLERAFYRPQGCPKVTGRRNRR